MKIKLAFLSKTDGAIHKDSIKSLLDKRFHDVTDQTFGFDLKNKTYNIEYSINVKNKFVALTLLYGESRICDAEVLSNVFDELYHTDAHKGFYIIILHDDLSELLCRKAYPHLGKFERSIRELIYIILLKAFGPKYVDKTIIKENRDRYKINTAKLIETCLYELTLAQLNEFLFAPYAEKSPIDIANTYTKTQLSVLEKSEALELLEACYPVNLWNRLFKKTLSFDLAETIENIREYRNDIAHNKIFHYKDYKEFQKSIVSATKEIEAAIKTVEEKRIDIESVYLRISQMQDFFKELNQQFAKNFNQPAKSLTQQFAEMNENIAKSIPPLTNNIVNPIKDSIKQLLDLLRNQFPYISDEDSEQENGEQEDPGEDDSGQDDSK